MEWALSGYLCCWGRKSRLLEVFLSSPHITSFSPFPFLILLSPPSFLLAKYSLLSLSLHTWTFMSPFPALLFCSFLLFSSLHFSFPHLHSFFSLPYYSYNLIFCEIVWRKEEGKEELISSILHPLPVSFHCSSCVLTKKFLSSLCPSLLFLPFSPPLPSFSLSPSASSISLSYSHTKI